YASLISGTYLKKFKKVSSSRGSDFKIFAMRKESQMVPDFGYVTIKTSDGRTELANFLRAMVRVTCCFRRSVKARGFIILKSPPNSTLAERPRHVSAACVSPQPLCFLGQKPGHLPDERDF